jgi:FkbM family methyltransferase
MIIKNYLKAWLRNFLEFFNLELRRKGGTNTYYHEAMSLMLCKHRHFLKENNEIEKSFITFCIDSYPNSFSQRSQDLFALWANSRPEAHKTDQKYCIEFGAADGRFISNTYLLSLEHKYKALLIEPEPSYFKRLKKNRPNDYCINAVVREEGIEHTDKVTLVKSGLLSHRKGLVSSNEIQEYIKNTRTGELKVNVVDLNTAIEENFGPNAKIINYISIDTEGSELEILKTIRFDKYKFNALTIECEGHHKEREEKIIQFLSEMGYQSIFERGITGVDIWFIPN